MAFFCGHNGCGAHALIMERREIEWTIVSPVSSLRFASMVKQLPAWYAAALAVLPYVQPPAAGETQTAH